MGRSTVSGLLGGTAEPTRGSAIRIRDGGAIAYFVAIGLLIGGLGLHHFTEPGEPFLGQLLSVAALVGIAGPLLGGAYWLRVRHGDRAWRAARWSLVGVAVITPLAVATVFYQRSHGVFLADVDVLLVWIAGTGATAGLVVGLYDIRREVSHERYRRTADRLSTVFQATPVALVELDTDGAVTRWNPAASRIFGWEPGEVVGRELPFAAENGPDWAAVAAGEDTLDGVEARCRAKDGSRLMGRLWSTTLRDAGEVTGTLVVIVDITDRIELERERQRQHEHLVRTETLANIGGWEYVPASETLRMTDGTRRIFELPEDYEPTVDDAIAHFHPEDRPIIEEAFEQCLESGVSYSVTVRVITDTGRQRWVHTKGERSYEKGAPRLSGVIQDITDRKMNEQRLMVLNRVLRHNLRNKLNAVVGYAELLEEQLPAEMEDHFRRIEESANSLISLAEKSRRFNEALEHDYTSGPVDLKSLLTELGSDLREKVPEADVRVELADVAVPANEEALRILFSELLENALKHNDRDDPAVRVTVARPADRRVAISIADNGPGLPATEQQVLEQGEETALTHSDGMGLWIVNWLMTKLSGGIEVAATDEGGTIVTLTLPRVEAD